MRIGLLAQEAYDEAGTNDNDPLSVTHLEAGNLITLEEAALVLADSAETAASLRRDLQEQERLIQLSDALESLREVMGQITEATPQHLRFFEIAGQLVVAGSEVEADRIIPAMESQADLVIATEGLVDTVKRIWQSILAFVQRAWAKITAFYRSSVVVSKYKKMIDDLKAEVKKAGDAHDEKKTFNISGAAHGLMLDMTTPKGWDELNKELKRLAHIDDIVFKTYATSVLERGGEIVKAINEFDPKTPAKSADYLKGKLLGMHSTGSEAGITDPFLGNGKLELQTYDKLEGEDSGVALERLRLSGLKYQKAATAKTIESGKDVMDGIPAASIPEMEGILDQAGELLEYLDVFYSRMSEQFDKTAKELQAASNKATQAMEKLDKAEFGDKSVEYYRTLLNFNKAFADWATEPFIPMYQHTLRVVNSLAALVRGSLTCYKVKA
jgi:hypothetical protein